MVRDSCGVISENPVGLTKQVIEVRCVDKRREHYSGAWETAIRSHDPRKANCVSDEAPSVPLLFGITSTLDDLFPVLAIIQSTDTPLPDCMTLPHQQHNTSK